MNHPAGERTARLVEMANDIAAYFAAESDPEVGAEGVRQHLVKFWEPGMRRKLKHHLQGGGDGLLPLARAAVEGLPESAAPQIVSAATVADDSRQT